MRGLLESWRQFLNENKGAKPMFKKAKIKKYIDLGLFAEAEKEEGEMLGAVVVIFDREGRVLILKRTDEMEWMPLKWGLPGGGIEEGEEPIDAAIREVKEETTLDIESPVEFHTSDMNVVYFTTTKYSGEVEIDFEHLDFAWVYPEELTNYDVIPGMENMISRAKEVLRMYA
jgi:8-oxo-dGTP pyrophosphatase MutT (NUDIX family)